MMKKQLLVLTIILLLQNSSAQLELLPEIVAGVEMFVEFLKTAAAGVHSVKDMVIDIREMSGGTEVTNVENIQQVEVHRRELVTLFEYMDTKIDSLKLFVADRFHQIQRVMNNLPQVFGIITKKQVVGQFVTNINDRWDEIMTFTKKRVSESVYNTVIRAHVQYMEQNLGNFRFAISPDKTQSLTTDGLFMDIANMHKNEKDILCNGQTAHHNIIHLFQIVCSTEMKAFILQVIALSDASPTTWNPMINYTLTSLLTQLQIYEFELKNALAIEDKPHIKACDSEELHHHSVSRSDTLYYRPKVLANDLFNCYPYYSKLGCDEMEKIQPVTRQGMYRGRSTCKRDLLASYEILTSFATNPSFFSTQSAEGCETRHVFEGVSYVCSCICRNYENLVLALMKSRVNHNYVVVAIRFQKTQNYIYIQIAEGKLEANGYISHFSWIQPTRKEDGEDPFDASLKINKEKKMALDDLQLPPNYVLTGIKFSRQSRSENEGLRIGLYGTKFNYTTGKLDPTNGTFVIASNEPGNDTSSSNDETAQPNSSQPTFVEFRGPELEEKNPPTMVLTLNNAAVEPNPLSPIGGAGVFYEIASDRTPRLSLRLFTIDYMPDADTPKN